MPLSQWICSALLAAVSVAPVLAGTKDAADAKATPEATATANPAAQPAPAAANPTPTPTLTPAAGTNTTALLGVLVMKGVLSPAEAKSIEAAPAGSEVQLLVDVLTRKGVVSASDLAAAPAAPAPAAEAAPATVAVAVATPQPAAAPASPPVAALPADAPPPPAVVPAIAPLRTLPVDPPKKDGLAAAFKMGPVKMTPYGFIKATAAKDTSAPNGDDFPFIGLFLNSTAVTSTGPTQDPEFHLKARSTRIGANFEWPDSSPKLTFTGKIEGDYEGNFSEVDNRDVSSIRSNAFQLRLAWARMDYAASDATDFYFEGGQDWTLFGSSVLPSILETTFLGAFYGDIYTRSPQFQFGLVQKLGGTFKLAPTFAIMMPSSGQILKLSGTLSGLEAQLGEGERAGADSGRPEVEGRLALQFQLDKAPGVASAQILWSGFESRRTAIAAAANYATCTPGTVLCTYEAAFPNGFTASSTQYGNQIGVQLPTRWFTLIGSAYRGADMRFFFGGQVNTYYTDIAGLSNPIQFQTIDGTLGAAGPTMLACTGPVNLATGACTGTVVVAPQKPIQGFGGFINLGLPLSRWFNANPKGHNAGWTLYFHAGKDQVVHRFLDFPANVNAGGNLPLLMGKVFAATLYYKVNPYVTFGIEQSVYGTRLEPGAMYNIAGGLDNLWQDHRTEFGPIFTF